MRCPSDWTTKNIAICLADARAATAEHMPEAIRYIRSSAAKMDNLINAILKLAREGQRMLRPERVELEDVISKSAAAIQHQLSEADGRIDLQFDIPPLLHDRLSLEQIFGNLLDNAVKYRSKQRPLRIEVRATRTADDRISVEVAVALYFTVGPGGRRRRRSAPCRQA